jgi:2,4-dienoyl-CoA reductase [(3E)-enoyl-CoA-producing], peroxisomal
MDRLSRKADDGSSIAIESTVPVQRMGSSLDIAHAAVYLFSEAASFVTGQVIVVDGASEDIRPLTLPYPQSVLDPESIKKMMKARL